MIAEGLEPVKQRVQRAPGHRLSTRAFLDYHGPAFMRALLQGLKLRISGRRRRWESLCRRCGLCCYEKEIRRGRVHVRMDSPCRYLDLKTRLCRVYDRRFRVCRECRKLRFVHARFSRWLPESCGYVRRFRGSRRSGPAVPQ